MRHGTGEGGLRVSRRGIPLSIEVENKADMVRQLRETFHDMRQPVASTMALAAAALTEPDLSRRRARPT